MNPSEKIAAEVEARLKKQATEKERHDDVQRRLSIAIAGIEATIKDLDPFKNRGMVLYTLALNELRVTLNLIKE